MQARTNTVQRMRIVYTVNLCSATIKHRKTLLRSKNTGELWVSQKLGVFFEIERVAKN